MSATASLAPRVCTRCVMDASNPGMRFDAQGRCNCCTDALARRPYEWWPDAAGRARMEAMVAALRAAGRGRPYDAMLGLSGGIDSAYLAHLAVRELGLRVLAVHVDAGWNSEPAVRNIESLVRALDLDLHTHVIEWSEMRDLQLSFLKASVYNQDIPQDHAFFATLYRVAGRFRLRHFLSGVNFASECINPPSQGSPTAIDGHHLRGIHRRWGSVPLRRYPVMGLSEYVWRTRLSGALTVFRPLNFIPYDKAEAKRVLEREYGWRDYGSKHSESRFTKFYQDIYLPRKFGFDKRRLHLSSLIVSGQLDRRGALAALEQAAITPEEARRDIRFVSKKLGIAVAELERLIDSPPVDHGAYPSRMRLHARLMAAKSMLRRVARPAVGGRLS